MFFPKFKDSKMKQKAGDQLAYAIFIYLRFCRKHLGLIYPKIPTPDETGSSASHLWCFWNVLQDASTQLSTMHTADGLLQIPTGPPRKSANLWACPLFINHGMIGESDWSWCWSNNRSRVPRPLPPKCIQRQRRIIGESHIGMIAQPFWKPEAGLASSDLYSPARSELGRQPRQRPFADL